MNEDINSDNIYQLNKLLDHDNKFLESGLEGYKGYTTICINSVDFERNPDSCLKYRDGGNIIYLLKRANGIFGCKAFAVTGRRTNYLIFKYGLGRLKMILEKYHMFEINSLINNAHQFLQINRKFEMNITGDMIFRMVFIENNENKNNENNNNENNIDNKNLWKEKILLSLSKEQRDEIREIKDTIGFSSEGLVGLLCVLESFNGIFAHCSGDINGNMKIQDFQDFAECECGSEIVKRRKYFDSRIIDIIKRLFGKESEELVKYLVDLRKLFRVRLERNRLNIDNGKSGIYTKDELEYMKITIEKIEKIEKSM